MYEIYGVIVDTLKKKEKAGTPYHVFMTFGKIMTKK